MPTTNQFVSNGIDIPFEFYAPVPATTTPGFVAIAYGTDGMSEPWGTQIRAYASALTHRGFAVMIPDYFASTRTSPGPAAFEVIGGYRDIWQKALADSITYAKANLAIDPGRVGLLGFSLGGHLSMRQRSYAKVLVEYFAPELDGFGDVTGTTSHSQIHHGMSDLIVPFSPNADDAKRLLTNEGAVVKVFSYAGAGHGFIGSDSSNTEARNNSSQRTLDCFTKFL